MYPYSITVKEMRERGYDAETIAEGEVAELLIKQIEEAFAGVKLGEGVSLREARAQDDWKDAAFCAREREKDEKEDWHRVSVQELNDYSDTLSFFDAEGMRFYLPAFLLADFRGTYKHDITDYLEGLSVHQERQFGLLNPAQREAVRSYLRYVEGFWSVELDRIEQ